MPQLIEAVIQPASGAGVVVPAHAAEEVGVGRAGDLQLLAVRPSTVSASPAVAALLALVAVVARVGAVGGARGFGVSAVFALCAVVALVAVVALLASSALVAVFALLAVVAVVAVWAAGTIASVDSSITLPVSAFCFTWGWSASPSSACRRRSSA